MSWLYVDGATLWTVFASALGIYVAVILITRLFQQVQAVIMETTSDISVLHGGEPIDPELLEGVGGTERLAVPTVASS